MSNAERVMEKIAREIQSELTARFWRMIIAADPYLSEYACFIGLPGPDFEIIINK